MSLAAQAVATSELELAARARRGEKDALVQLYRANHDALLRHARRMLGDDAAARDMVQEGFARAIAAIPKTREELRFRAWIFRIVTNLCLRELTRRSRHRPDMLGNDRAAPVDKTHPDRGVRRREIGTLVQRALSRLPSRYKQILLLRELQELSYDELAGALEMSKASVKVTLHRARQRFSALFISEQLAQNPAISVTCGALKAAMGSADRRNVVRHLESCKHCRKGNRPAAELFALLPPLPALPAASGPAPWEGPASPQTSAQAGSQASQAAQATQTASSASAAASGGGLTGGLGAWIAGGALACSAAALVVVFGLSKHGGAAQPVTKPQRHGTAQHRPPVAQTTAPQVTSSVETAVRPHALDAHLKARPQRVEPRRSRRRAATRRRPTHASRATTSKTATASKTASKTPTASRTVSETRPPLRIKLRVARGTAWVARGAARFPVDKKTDLARGDVLHTRRGRHLAMILPGHQWISFSGVLKLVDVAARGEPASTAVIRLRSGSLRARASRRGGGLWIRVAQREVRAGHGELRLRRRGDTLHVESVDAHLIITGPHASRTLSAGTGAILGRHPGFAHALAAPPSKLRPTRYRGRSAPTLRWRHSASRYRVIVARDADFLLPEEIARVDGLSYRPKLGAPGKHFWKVQALRGGGRGFPSKIYSFVITE